MNRVMLIGRITKDLELRETKSGKKVCEFTLATNRVNGKDADFITCMVWDKQAENLCKFQGKGSLIGVDGTLRTDSYEVEGKKRQKTYVMVNVIDFLGEKKEEKVDKNKPFEEFGQQFEVGQQLEIEDNEYPF